MPGRDELIQQNAARAAYKADNSPRLQESVGKSSESAPLTSSFSLGPQSFFGGNYEVYSALESIEFQGNLGDGSMRGSVAYIRKWKRGGSAQVSSGGGLGGLSSSGGDYLSELNALVTEAVGNRESFEGTIETDVSNGYAIITSPDFEQDEDGNIISGDRQTIVVPSQSSQTQRNLSEVTPVTSAERKTPSALVGPSSFPRQGARRVSPFLQSSRLFGPTPIFVTTPGIGAEKSANPNGFTNILAGAALGAIGFRQSYPSYLQGPRSSPPPYAGGANAPSSSASSVLGEMMWQFLFNPSEMELEVGPEYKSAETWGVSDKANSGQPLHWSHNKNARLKFNSILLNGYVFGRKVEALEQGLIELFMSRDGDGQHGPHVLEFVWGKRVFGPCVIKSIAIKEKMWDEGEVVNAELSFTLEQVPEWTINDGAYVDVARPGRRPLQEEAAQLGSSSGTGTGIGTGAGAGATAAPSTPPGGGNSGSQGSREQNRLTPTELYKKCQRAGVYAQQFFEIEKNSKPTGSESIGLVSRQRSLYSTLYPQAVNELGIEFTSRIKNPNANPTDLYKSTELAIKQENDKSGLAAITRNYARAMGYVQSAANSGRLAAKSFSDSSRCKNERRRVDTQTKAQLKSKECDKKRLGSPCQNNGADVYTCSGIRLKCAGGVLRDPSKIKV